MADQADVWWRNKSDDDDDNRPLDKAHAACLSSTSDAWKFKGEGAGQR